MSDATITTVPAVTRFMDVHIFHATNTVVLIHMEPMYGELSPIVTWINVTSNQAYADPSWLVVMAESLCALSDESTTFVEHTSNGERYTWTKGAPRRVKA